MRHRGIKKVVKHLLLQVVSDDHALQLFSDASDDAGRSAFMESIWPTIRDCGLCTERAVRRTD